ncbi:archaellin/type IV pilin N-terminal domain-containing protein [Halovenus marina]|uniref:archaellin/type IV pilin N-terminal domain-containing protein n=1 Tax=Halovenus marina TaxID=3396621 RepID=UPI003F557662
MRPLTIDDDRGQVGIGTLIVFIAMVLVAAIAAGVLINTAGFLQSQSEQTGQQSTEQVTDRLQAVSTSGEVDTSEGLIYEVNVTVSKAPGAGDINLLNVTAQWTGPSGSYDILNSLVAGGDEDGSTVEGFTTDDFKDASDSYDRGDSEVLTSSDDRFIMTFTLGTSSYSLGSGSLTAPDATNGERITDGPEPIGENEEVLIELTTQSGGVTEVRFKTPASLRSESSVSL